MNTYHRDILHRIKAVPHREAMAKMPEHYLGNNHLMYCVTTGDSRKIAKDWADLHKDIPLSELIETLNSLAEGESVDEKMMVGKIIGYLSKRRVEIEPSYLDRWLDHFEGWAEVDSLCQSSFSDKDLLANWDAWEKFLTKLAQDKNIAKRRASLVLLVSAAGHSLDKRFLEMALKNIDLAKSERDSMLTKAVSWLLRVLIRYHREEVERYLNANADSLPPIAIRETRNKLLTGKKKVL